MRLIRSVVYLLPSILRRPSFMSELWNVQTLSSAGSNNGVVLKSNVYNVHNRVLIGREPNKP